jgi:PAS domain S-box-containing protein
MAEPIAIAENKVSIGSVPVHGVLEFDALGRLVFANPIFCARSGMSLEQLLGRSIESLVAPVSLELLGSIFKKRNSASHLVELTLVGPQGDRRVMASVVSFIGPEGSFEGSVFFLSPTQTLNLGTQDLLWSEQRFRLLLNEAREILVVTDADTRIQYVNSAVEKSLGYRPEELLGQTPDSLFPTEDLEKVQRERDAWSKLPSTPVPFYRRMVHKDGGLKVFEGVAVNLLHDPLVQGFVFCLNDITEQEQLRNRVQEARRLEGIGRLAGGVAHDFNNILTVVLGQVELMESRAGSDAKLLRGLDEIRVAAHRASGLVAQLLAFARRSVVVPKALDLAATIHALIPALERLVTQHVQLTTDLPAGLSQILADPQQVEQVLLNLAANARDAMPQGGRLSVACRLAHISAGPQVSRDLRPGDYICMAVTDTGSGMDDLTREHAFEPFFTTKSGGSNTGMGLSTCYGIVKQSGGHIDVSSWPGEGTKFEVYWPLAKAPAAGKSGGEQSDIASLLHGNGELVLLVDDEAQLRDFVSEGLLALGYSVHSCSDGASALAWVEQGGKPRLLITDMKMPGIGGEALAGRMQLLAPALPVLYISGYAASAVARSSWLKPGINFLPKPFKLGDLAKALRRMLDGAA